AERPLIALLNTSASVVTVTGPVNGSLNGDSTYFDGSSSVPMRASTMAIACDFTLLMIEPMLPVVSMENDSVGPTPNSSLSWRGVTCDLMSRKNCFVASLATATAAEWRPLCGENSQSVESLLM